MAEDWVRDEVAALSPEEKIALAALASDSPMQPMRFQKVALLVTKLMGQDSVLDAEAFHFGAFSENLIHAMDDLKEAGVLSAMEPKLTDFGRQVLSEWMRTEPEWGRAEALVRATRSIPEKELVAITYELFPKLTEKSRIKEDLPYRQSYAFFEHVLASGDSWEVPVTADHPIIVTRG